VDHYFSNTKAIVAATHQEYYTSLMKRAQEESTQLVAWLDPSLKEAAERLMVYKTLKNAAYAAKERRRKEEERGKANDEDEKVKHERWLRRLHIKQSIT
jgi:hypothetical protein